MKRHLYISLLFISVYTISAQENAFPLTSTIWAENIINVCWENPTPTNLLGRELVETSIKNTWQKHSQLEFVGWGQCGANDRGIRIFIDDAGPHTKGLGNTLDGKKNGMVLNFVFNRWSRGCKVSLDFCIRGIAVHEFGHALGFAHEQNRKDCKFKNCLGREQGSDGDWFISRCDPNSVMNYCNPNYNNNGELSEIDIKSVQHIYGVPNESPEFEGELSLAHTANQVKRRGLTHEIKIYLVGPEDLLDEVDFVRYKLHETFPNPIVDVSNRESKFGLGLRAWGQFTLFADVIYKDGKTQELTRYLSFEEEGSRVKK